MTQLPDILIQEVAPRDGLQIELKWVETGDKIASDRFTVRHWLRAH